MHDQRVRMPPLKIRRSRHSCATFARRSFGVEVLWMSAVLLVAGCASFGRRSPVPEEVAACRELSRQGAGAMEIGEWGRAESLLNQAVESVPDDAEPRRYLAEALWHRGAASEALKQIEMAVKLDSKDASLTVRAGEMLLAAGAADAALTRAEQAIRLDPKLSSAWALRGRVFWQKGERDRALADLQRALQYAPENPELLLDVAVLYRQRGQSARSLATIHHLLDTYPPGEEPQLPLLLEGQALAELGRPGQAAESLLAAVRRGPANAEVLYQLAQAQSNSGDYAAATATAQQALAVDASHHASRELLVQLAAAATPVEPQRR